MSFAASLRWKREYKSDREKYDLPYLYPLNDGGTFTIHQSRFQAVGFASTVWDSSIAISKYLERHPEIVKGHRCLDLSAGCGLVACVMSHLDAEAVVATDLSWNLPLLQQNCRLNQKSIDIGIEVYTWGAEVKRSLSTTFDRIVACDVMYLPSQIDNLLRSFDRLMGVSSMAIVVHGRNANAEERFLEEGRGLFEMEAIDWDDFDPNFRSEEITAFRLRKQ